MEARGDTELYIMFDQNGLQKTYILHCAPLLISLRIESRLE